MNEWITRAAIDCELAMEEGTFAVETPTTCVEQSGMDRLQIGRQFHTSFGGGYWTLNVGVECRGSKLAKDVSGRDVDIVLHGYEHLWDVKIADKIDIEATVGYDAGHDLDSLPECVDFSAEIVEIAEAGWKRP